jgi:hypothetical protein
MRSAVLDDLVKNGLPSWVYTWRTVFAIMFLGPIVVMTLGSGFSMAWGLVVGESRHAPDCYTLSGAPLVSSHRLFDADNRDIAEVQPAHDKVVADVIAAIKECQPGRCGSAQRAAYRKAATGYVSARAWASQRMFVRYGDAGLSFAGTIYGTGVDSQIVYALRAGFEAGLLDISRLHSLEQPMRMLLFRPLTDFKLCRAE